VSGLVVAWRMYETHPPSALHYLAPAESNLS
jgi:hypothetical protein